MRKTIVRLITALVLSALLLGLLCAGSARAAVTFSDVKGHWGESYIYSGVEKGYIKGYTDGTFKPDKTVTRAEFSKMLNQAIGMNRVATVGFTDVPTTAWYFDEVRKAVAAGYIAGYSDNTFRPDIPITRQEAAVIVARVVSEPGTAKSVTALGDSGSIASWALPYVRTVYTKGYMVGDELGRFNPESPLTRAAAAKVITLLLNGERIVSADNQIISVPGMKYEDTLFANDVTISSALGDGGVTLKNCRVIGTLTVNGGGDLDGLVLDNVAVNKLVLADADGDVHVRMTKGTAVKETSVQRGAYLEEDAALTGAGVTDLALSGKSLDSETLRLAGKFGKLSAGCSTILNADKATVEELALTAKGNLTLQKGDFALLTVEKGAKGSNINISRSVTVDKAVVNAETAFTGEGEIAYCEEKAAGVTYETKPRRLIAYSGAVDPTDPEQGTVEDQKLVPTISPADGSTDIAISRVIKLTFPQTIYKLNGNSMTAAYLEDTVVELRKTSASGTKVDFTASLSTNGRVVSITPDSPLSSNTKYYVVVTKNSIVNASGSTNPRAVFSFTTQKDTYLTPTVSPTDGKTDVSRTTTVKLTFADAVYKASGAELTSAYVESSAVEIHKGTVDGPLLGFAATISSTNKVLTLSPDESLEADTEYFVVVNRGTLSDENGNLNTRFVSTFSTGKTVSRLITFDPANKAENVVSTTDITISFLYPVQRGTGAVLREAYVESTAIALRKGSQTGTALPFTAVISNDGKTIKLTPEEELSNSTTYYVVIKENTLQYEGGDKIPETVSYFKTGDGKGKISSLTVSDVTAETADLEVLSTVNGTVDLTIKPATGTTQTKQVTVKAGVRKSVPLTDLYPNTRYTVTATVTDSAGRVSAASSVSFTTEVVELKLEVVKVTKNSAQVKASFSVPGKLTVSYSPYAPKESGVVLSNFIPADGVTSKTVDLTDLKEKTTYTVTLVHESDNGKTTTVRTTFSTEFTSTDTSLASLRVVGADGTYSAVLGSGNTYQATISAMGANSVRLIPTATNENAEITIDGKSVQSGSASGPIPISVGELTKVNIVVTAESGDTKAYSLEITVNP